MIEAFRKRRSAREYLSQPLPEEKLKEILTAAMFAPSANAHYPWDLVVVRNSQIKERLSKLTPWSTHAEKAAAVIVVVGHEKESNDWVEDCSIAAEHIWLESVNQGFGSCWIQIRGNDNAEKEVKNLLNIPADYRVLCLMPIGVPAEALPEHTEEDFDKSKIKQEHY